MWDDIWYGDWRTSASTSVGFEIRRNERAEARSVEHFSRPSQHQAEHRRVAACTYTTNNSTDINFLHEQHQQPNSLGGPNISALAPSDASYVKGRCTCLDEILFQSGCESATRDNAVYGDLHSGMCAVLWQGHRWMTGVVNRSTDPTIASTVVCCSGGKHEDRSGRALCR